MKTTIIFGCDGRQEEGIVFCNGVQNEILDLENIVVNEQRVILTEYLTKTVKLFSSPCFNTNLITNTIYKIYELGIFSDKKYKYLVHFFNLHKQCGPYLKVKKET